MKKAQVSTEFLFSIGMILFLFLIIFAFTFNRRMELRESEIEVDKRNTCLLVSSLMTSAFVNGDGVIINETIGYNSNVSMGIGSRYKELTVEGISCLMAVPSPPDTPTPKLHKGEIKIENTNNAILIKDV